MSIVEFYKEQFYEDITYYDICESSETYDWVEHEVGIWRDKSINYVNKKWGVLFDYDSWLEQVHHTMFFGTDEDEDLITEDLYGMFVSDKDWEHFWNTTGVLHNTVMWSIWDDLVKTWSMRMSKLLDEENE